MKFIQKKETVGATRVIEGFLWFPMWIDNDLRWFEFARWREDVVYSNHRFAIGVNPLPTNKPTLNFRWRPVEWLDGGTHDDTDWPRN